MSAIAENRISSETDYLAWESRAKEKHEYIAGEIFAMAVPASAITGLV